MINIQDMMKKAQAMQHKLAELQEKFADIEVSGEAGGGLVKVSMLCNGKVTGVQIDPSVMDDKDTLEDLIVAAMNNTTQAKEERVQNETKNAMEGMGLPEGAQLPF